MSAKRAYDDDEDDPDDDFMQESLDSEMSVESASNGSRDKRQTPGIQIKNVGLDTPIGKSELEELCDTFAEKTTFNGHLLRSCGHSVLSKEFCIIHVAESFLVAVYIPKNELFAFAYKTAPTPHHGLEYYVDETPISLFNSNTVDINDLPLTYACGTFPFDAQNVDDDVSKWLFGICDQNGKTQIWNVQTGRLLLTTVFTRNPNKTSSLAVSPNAFAFSPSHIIISVAPSQTHSMLYYQKWSPEDVPQCDPHLFHTLSESDRGKFANTLSTSSNLTEMTFTSATGIRSIAAANPYCDALFYLVCHGGLATIRLDMPSFLCVAIPSGHWPSYIHEDYRALPPLSAGSAPTETAGVIRKERIALLEKYEHVQNIVRECEINLTSWAKDMKVHTMLHVFSSIMDESYPKTEWCEMMLLLYKRCVGASEMTSSETKVFEKFDACAALYRTWPECVETFEAWMNVVFLVVHRRIMANLPHLTNIVPDEVACSPVGVWIYNFQQRVQEHQADEEQPKLSEKTILTAWYNQLMNLLQSQLTIIQKNHELLCKIRRLKVPSLKPAHKPIAIHCHDMANSVVIPNGVVFTDLSKQLIMPVRLTAAVYSVCVDTGTIVSCADATLKYVEYLSSTTVPSVSTVFLNKLDDSADTCEIYKKTENVTPVSTLSRINGTTVATHTFENHVWFYETVPLNTSEASDNKHVEGDMRQGIYDPPAREISFPATVSVPPSDKAMEIAILAKSAPAKRVSPRDSPLPMIEETDGDHVDDEEEEEYEVYDIHEGQEREDGSFFTTSITEDARLTMKTEQEKLQQSLAEGVQPLDPGACVLIEDIHDYMDEYEATQGTPDHHTDFEI